MGWEIEKIIEVAQSLNQTGSTGASTGETIAAAFVLNRMDYLPGGYSDVVEAWDRLDEDWQAYVRLIKREYLYMFEVITKERYAELQLECQGLEMEIAKGQDTPEIDARLREVNRLMDNAPWAMDMDTYEVVERSESDNR